MIQQTTASNLANPDADQTRAANTTPRAAHDFAALFADVLGTRAQAAPGLAQAVRDELKNPNEVNLGAIAAGELTSASEESAVQFGAPSRPEPARAEAPPPASPPPSARPAPPPDLTTPPDSRQASAGARADANAAQSSPTDAQTRHSDAQPVRQAHTAAAANTSVPTAGSAAPATAAGASASTRIEALSGLSRAGSGTDHKAALSAFRKPSQPIFHVEKQQLPSQVSRTLASIIARGGGRLTLRLSPQALGDVRVDVELREGTANATFRAENEAARDLLKGNLDALRNALERRGVRVERLEVVGPHSESATPTSQSDRIDGRESAASDQQQPWNGRSAAQARRAPAEAGGGNRFEPEAEPGSATGPCVVVQRSIEGTVLRLDAIA